MREQYYVLLYANTCVLLAYVFTEARPQRTAHLISYMILLKQGPSESFTSKIPAPKQLTKARSQHQRNASVAAALHNHTCNVSW